MNFAVVDISLIDPRDYSYFTGQFPEDLLIRHGSARQWSFDPRHAQVFTEDKARDLLAYCIRNNPVQYKYGLISESDLLVRTVLDS